MKLSAACVVIALATGFATASLAEGDGGCERACKGNNGWGNGGDATNSGSAAGGTAGTKLDSSLR